MLKKTPPNAGKLQQVKEKEKPEHATLKIGNADFKIIVYVEDDCKPCDLMLDAVVDVEALNKHVEFEIVNITYTNPQHEVTITPTIYSVTRDGRAIVRAQSATAVPSLNVKLVEEILAGSYIYTHPYTETLLENIMKVSRNCNMCLNDPAVTQRLLVKILRNVDELGAPLCPCRPLKPEEYDDYSCPCVEARTMCKCHCTLLVNQVKTPFTKQVEYLDLLSQIMLRLSGAINTLVEDNVKEAKFTVSRGLLSTLLEMSATLNEITHSVMRRYRKNAETVK